MKTRTIMYEQQIERLPMPVEDIKAVLEEYAEKRKGFKYAFVIHDKDVTKTGEPVEPHLHVMAQLGVGQQWTLDRWAKTFNDKAQQVTNWRGQYNTGVSYLMHMTDGAVKDGKHLYGPEEVMANMDVETFIKDSKKRIENSAQATVNEALMRLDAGTNTLDELASELLGKLKVDFLRKAKTIVEYKESIDHASNEMKTIYIYGNSGMGKTRLANELTNQKAYVTGSTRDPYAGYGGEKAVIWDDARFNGIDVSELLKLIDPYNRRRVVGSRYHDKNLNPVEVMYITAIEPPQHLWSKAFPGEPYQQFKRRLADVYHVNDDGTYEIESTREVKELPWLERDALAESDDAYE